MYSIRFSRLRMNTWAAWNGFGASTVPDKAAVPGSDAARAMVWNAGPIESEKMTAAIPRAISNVHSRLNDFMRDSSLSTGLLQILKIQLCAQLQQPRTER